MAGKKGNPNFKAKKGEAGYHERNTAAAHEAAAKSWRVFETPEELHEAICGYFDDCDARGELYSEAGLCLWLSTHNRKGRNVLLQTLHDWYDGTNCTDLREEVQIAYLRIQHQIETDPRYSDKPMVPYRIFSLKQRRLGGKTDKTDVNTDVRVELTVKDYDPEMFK